MDVGIQMDSGGSPDFNSGFFENGIMKGEDGAGGREVKVSFDDPFFSRFVRGFPFADRLFLLRFVSFDFVGDWKRACSHRTSLNSSFSPRRERSWAR